MLKFGSRQEGFWGTLIKLTFSPTCVIWYRWIIRPFENVHQVWEHLDMFGNVKLLKLQNGQKWFWGDFMGLYYSPWHDTCQGHQTCHMWHAKIFLELLGNIYFVNISKAWNIQKEFWGVWPIIWTWWCVETLIYGKYMSIEFPWFFSNIFEALKIILTY